METLGLLAEVAVAITTADVGGVLAMRGWSIQVALQAGAAMASWPASYAIAARGTSRGSTKKVPKNLTVAN